jgi:hypothetical protein
MHFGVISLESEGWKYIAAIFDFVEKLLASNGAMLLLHPNTFKVWKEVRFKWNGLWWTHYHSQVTTTHLSRFHHNPISFIIFCFFSPLTKICLSILQTLLSYATHFVKVHDGSFLVNGRFVFSSPSDEFMNNVFMFVMRMCCIIGWIGPLCLYPRLATL